MPSRVSWRPILRRVRLGQTNACARFRFVRPVCHRPRAVTYGCAEDSRRFRTHRAEVEDLPNAIGDFRAGLSASANGQTRPYGSAGLPERCQCPPLVASTMLVAVREDVDHGGKHLIDGVLPRFPLADSRPRRSTQWDQPLPVGSIDFWASSSSTRCGTRLRVANHTWCSPAGHRLRRFPV